MRSSASKVADTSIVISNCPSSRPEPRQRIPTTIKYPEDEYPGFVNKDLTIGYLKKRNEKLEKQNEKLEKQNEEKKNLLKAISHEVRTPLTVFYHSLGEIKVINQNQEIDDLVKNSFDMIECLESFVDTILIDERSKKLDPNQLNDLIKSVVSGMSLTCKEQNINLICKLCQELVFVRCITSEICRALLALLNNAVKFTIDNNGNTIVVELSFDKESNKCTISIKDSGIGIKSEFLPNIFEEGFTRDSVKGRGSGIGLNQVKQIVDIHKGTIVVKSEGENRGTEFIICFPLFEEKSDVNL